MTETDEVETEVEPGTLPQGMPLLDASGMHIGWTEHDPDGAQAAAFDEVTARMAAGEDPHPVEPVDVEALIASISGKGKRFDSAESDAPQSVDAGPPPSAPSRADLGLPEPEPAPVEERKPRVRRTAAARRPASR